VRAGQLGARRTGDEERHRIRFYFLFLEIVSMVGEPNKMTAAHPIAVEANHKTWKSIKKTTATRAPAGDPGHVGRDYSASDNERNHSPLMKERPESRHPVGGRRSSELSRDQRGGPSLGREPPSLPTVSNSVVRLP
jgi:hypothetical protein